MGGLTKPKPNNTFHKARTVISSSNCLGLLNRGYDDGKLMYEKKGRNIREKHIPNEIQNYPKNFYNVRIVK